jgi:hypothetical protein
LSIVFKLNRACAKAARAAYGFRALREAACGKQI